MRTSARLSNLYQSTNWKICKRHVNGSLWSWLSIISTFPSNFLVCMCLFSSRVCVLLATFLVIQYSPKKKVKEKWTKHRRPTAKESETKCCYGENLIRIRSEISHIFVVIESIEAQSDKTYIESFATHTFVPGTEAVIQFQLITMADRNAISCSYSRHIFSLKWFHLWAFGGYWVRASNLV